MYANALNICLPTLMLVHTWYKESTPGLPPKVHPIILWGYPGLAHKFSTNHVGTQGLALGGDWCQLASLAHLKVFTYERR